MAEGNKRFTQEEVGLILHKASELQERLARTRATGDLSLAEIKQIAAEVGIEAELVDRAALSLPAEGAGATAILVGAPWAWSDESAVPGEVPEEEMGRVLHAIRTAVGRPGDVETHFRSLEWKENHDGMGGIVVRVTPRDGRTRVEALVRRGEEAGLVLTMSPFGGAMLGMIAAGIVEPATTLGGAGLAGAGMLAGWLGGRRLWQHLARRWEKRIHGIQEAVTRAVSEAAE